MALPLPTDPAVLSPTVSTPANHASWHSDLHAIHAESPAQPTPILTTDTGNLAAHEALHTLLGLALPTSLDEDDPDHPRHHSILHLLTNPYGVQGTIGEANEPTTTTGTEATTGTITSVLAAANPGDTVLLRAGSYSGFTIPAGAPGQPITVKPYNGEAITVTSQFTMNSYTRLAGVKAESTGAQWLVRIGSTTSTAITDVEIRNCTLRGGTTEAVRVRQNATNIRLLNCDLEGGQTGHVVKFHYESITTYQPSGSITNCRLRKRNIAGGGIYNYATTEDLLQLEGHGVVTVDQVTFGIMQASTSAEDGLDVKTPGTGGSALISRCLFEGPFGAEAGILQAQSDDTTVRDCKVVSDRLLIGATSQNVSATVERVWFTSGSTLLIRRSGESPRLPARVRDVLMDAGTLQLGTTTGGDQPTNAELTRLWLVGTNIVVNTGSTYVCTDAMLSGTTGASLTCT